MSGTDIAVRTDGRNVVTASGAPVGTPVQYQEQQRTAPSDHKAPATFHMQRELDAFVSRACDKDGYLADAAILAVGDGLLSSGYSLRAAAGVEIHAVEAWTMLSICREAGVDQATLDRFFAVMKRRQGR